MPDLSFYPESVLRERAVGNPVRFGQEHREKIARLVDVADLSLLPFEEAREGISRTLDSDDPLEVYWGLITCSCFGDEAREFYETAKALCENSDLLVRTRAAEFLGLAGKMDPAPVILQALEESADAAEALLILNSLVLLKDGPHAYKFDVSKLELNPVLAGDPMVQWRMDYLSAGTIQL
jgi:HEAT repeat protein